MFSTGFRYAYYRVCKKNRIYKKKLPRRANRYAVSSGAFRKEFNTVDYSP